MTRLAPTPASRLPLSTVGTTIAGEPPAPAAIAGIADIGPLASARGAGCAIMVGGIGALPPANSGRGIGGAIIGAIGGGIGFSAAREPTAGATGGIGCMIGGGIVPPG